MADFAEGEFGVGFVRGDEVDGADADETIEDGAAELDVEDAEHIQIVHSSVKNAAGVFDSVGGDFVVRHFEPEDFYKENKTDKNHKTDAGKDAVTAVGDSL